MTETQQYRIYDVQQALALGRSHAINVLVQAAHTGTKTQLQIYLRRTQEIQTAETGLTSFDPIVAVADMYIRLVENDPRWEELPEPNATGLERDPQTVASITKIVHSHTLVIEKAELGNIPLITWEQMRTYATGICIAESMITEDPERFIHRKIFEYAGDDTHQHLITRSALSAIIHLWRKKYHNPELVQTISNIPKEEVLFEMDVCFAMEMGRIIAARYLAFDKQQTPLDRYSYVTIVGEQGIWKYDAIRFPLLFAATVTFVHLSTDRGVTPFEIPIGDVIDVADDAPLLLYAAAKIECLRQNTILSRGQTLVQRLITDGVPFPHALLAVALSEMASVGEQNMSEMTHAIAQGTGELAAVKAGTNGNVPIGAIMLEIEAALQRGRELGLETPIQQTDISIIMGAIEFSVLISDSPEPTVMNQ